MAWQDRGEIIADRQLEILSGKPAEICPALFGRTGKASSRGCRQDGEAGLEVRSTRKIRLSSLWF
jgi:hypothetical protein